jgi:hypothetical protein
MPPNQKSSKILENPENSSKVLNIPLKFSNIPEILKNLEIPSTILIIPSCLQKYPSEYLLTPQI